MMQQQNKEKIDFSTHFEFGENWHEFSNAIDREMIDESKRELMDLIGEGNIAGKTFLDIGCGSGMHALSALELGAKMVIAIDLDPVSVETAKSVIKKFWDRDNYEVSLKDILTDFNDPQESYDILYSWGVLHHTGAMWDAIEKASHLVRPGGLFVIAIYKKNSLLFILEVGKTAIQIHSQDDYLCDYDNICRHILSIDTYDGKKPVSICEEVWE